MIHAVLRARSGALVADGRAWTGPVTAADDRVLARVDGPVLDVGCGPGRHVLALARRGIVTLGIDVSLPALAMARHRNAPVLERSVFSRVPAAGRWGTALLLDGNIGIGGHPELLLERVTELLRRGGRIVVEVAPAGTHVAGSEQVRFEVDGIAGPWFDWAVVDLDALDRVADARGLAVQEHWVDHGRGFAWLA